MAHTRRWVLGGLAGSAAACGPAARDGGPEGRVRLRFATDWRAQAEHGGFYQAKALGLYEAEGLDVAIIQGGPAVNVPQLLASGGVELGLGANSFQPLNMVRAGFPAMAVMACFQKDPQVLIAHPEPKLSGIGAIKDRPIYISEAALGGLWRWLKARFGFTDSQARKYANSLAPFLSDPQVIQQGYVSSEPFAIERALGAPPQVFLIADEGFMSYSCLVLSAKAFSETQPEAVAAFVRATAEGWRSYLYEDPAPADRLIQADNPDMGSDLLAYARKVMVARGIVAPAGSPIGAMDPTRWEGFFKDMAGLDLLPTDLDWRAAFTTRFLP